MVRPASPVPGANSKVDFMLGPDLPLQMWRASQVRITPRLAVLSRRKIAFEARWPGCFFRGRLNRLHRRGINLWTRSEIVSIQDRIDQPDFAELAARVYRLCLALIGDEPNARDATQESLMRAWRDRRRRRPDVSWWTWAAGFALRVCRESRRRRTGPRCLWQNSAAVLVTNKVEGADRDRLQAVHEAIVGLPDRQREVVVLRFLLGQSTEACAQMLDCPIGTVKSNLYNAVRNLRARVFEIEDTSDLRRM